MKIFEKVRSTVKPEGLEIDAYSVWINENITEIEVENEIQNAEENSTPSTHIEYEYDVIQYDKDAYIKRQAEQITDTELALCEIYESLGV